MVFCKLRQQHLANLRKARQANPHTCVPLRNGKKRATKKEQEARKRPQKKNATKTMKKKLPKTQRVANAKYAGACSAKKRREWVQKRLQAAQVRLLLVLCMF